MLKSIKEVDVQPEDSASERLESEQDSEISIVLVTGNAGYSLIELRSFKDDSVKIRIEQENKNDALLLYAKDEAVHAYMRELCGVQNGDIQLLLDAVHITYLSAGNEWVALPDSQVTELKSLAGGMVRIPNHSSGCPFDLRLIVETNGEKYDAAISTDSCGIVIIGDQTYQVDKEHRDVLKTIFEDAPWGGS